MNSDRTPLQRSDELIVRRSDASIVAETCHVRVVPFDAPWNWLSAGWRDMWASPLISLGHGAAFAIAAAAILLGLVHIGWASLILALGGGFLLIGPFVAVGLYEASRQLASGRSPTFSSIAYASLHAPGRLGFMGALLFLIYFAWLQLAFLLFMLFLGTGDLPPASEFVPTLLFTTRGLLLLIVGTLAGACIAAGVFAISAISIPLLLDRRVDTITAISASLEAVQKNPKPMALWAGLIAAFMLCGCLTLCLGLVLAFPLIGHASWHAYLDIAGQSSGAD